MKTLLITLLVLSMASVHAQDTHFSHIHASPLHNNPAWTGVINDNFRLIANYRNQWKSPTANFNTFSVSFDGKYVLPKTMIALNGGISFQADKGGDLGYGDHNYNFLAGTAFPLGRKRIHNFTLGVQAGFIKHHLDVSAIQAIDEEPLVEDIVLGQTGVDLSVGGGYFMSLTPDRSIYAGLAVYHINRPNVSIIEGMEVNLYKRWVGSLGMNWVLDGGIGLQPSALVYLQGPHREVNMGSYISFPVTESYRGQGHDTRLYFGVWGRYYIHSKYKSGFDALIFSTRYDMDKLVVSFSCDLTLSKLTSANGLVGSPELSVMYTIPTNKRSKQVKPRVDCPKF